MMQPMKKKAKAIQVISGMPRKLAMDQSVIHWACTRAARLS